MLPRQGFNYDFDESWLNDQINGHVQEPPTQSTLDIMMMKSMDGEDSIISSASTKAAQIRNSTEAGKSHKEAERRRRQRINAHFSNLRTLLPNATKTDKASLLAEVVHCVKDLKKQAADVARQYGDRLCSTTTGLTPEPEPETWPFPSELDEASLSYCDNEAKIMRATLCCEDRPGLCNDLSHAILSVRARAIRAEMMTVGGRAKNVVVLKWAGGGDEEEFGALKRALKAVVENRVSGSGPDYDLPGNKRARVFSCY